MRSKSITRLRTTALVLGVIGGLAALVASLSGPDAGPFAAALIALRAIPFTDVVNGFVLAIVGIVGGALARTQPPAASGLMIASAVGVLLVIGPAASIGAVLLLAGAFLAFMARTPAPVTA